MIDYEYICPSCGKPMKVYEPHMERKIFKSDPAIFGVGVARCEKCQIKVMSPDRLTIVNDSAHEEEKLEKAQAAFDNMLKSFGIKKRPKLPKQKPCPVCGCLDFDIDYSEPSEGVKGKWFASVAQIKCEGCGMLWRADFAFSTSKSEAERISDLANKAVVNAWNTLEGASNDKLHD